MSAAVTLDEPDGLPAIDDERFPLAIRQDLRDIALNAGHSGTEIDAFMRATIPPGSEQWQRLEAFRAECVRYIAAHTAFARAHEPPALTRPDAPRLPPSGLA